MVVVLAVAQIAYLVEGEDTGATFASLAGTTGAFFFVEDRRERD